MFIKPLSEEKKRFLELHSKYTTISMPFTGAIVLFMLVWTVGDFLPKSKFPFWGMSLCIFAPILTSFYFLTKRNERKWIQNLTAEELEIIKIRAESGAVDFLDTVKSAQKMLKAYNQITGEPQNELLRASEPTDDSMLLRPTAASIETPKEELLRASGEEA